MKELLIKAKGNLARTFGWGNRSAGDGGTAGGVAQSTTFRNEVRNLISYAELGKKKKKDMHVFEQKILQLMRIKEVFNID